MDLQCRHRQPGATPGQRFGALGGLAPPWPAGRFGPVRSELAYYRHRAGMVGGNITDPKGRVHIGYADGHVALKSETDLADPVTGLSTLDSWWSPIDDQLNQ